MDQTAAFALGGVIGIVIVAVIGLVIGAIAKLLMPGRDPGGWFATILLGIAGSWVWSFLMTLIGLNGVMPYLVGAVAGAMLLLAVFRLVKKT